MLPKITEHVSLAGSDGEGKPIITYDKVSFNGSKHCGHPVDEDVTIPWPSDDAGGIAEAFEEAKAGRWNFGTMLQKRTCGGDCSYESFVFPRILDDDGFARQIGEIGYYDQEGKPVYNEKNRVGKYFDFCKTAFRPYDWAVITFLIIAKHYIKNRIVVASDGTDNQWFDGKLLCQSELGYGLEYEKTEGELIVPKKAKVTA